MVSFCCCFKNVFKIFFLEVLGLQENFKEGTEVSHIIFSCPDKYMAFPLSTLLTWRVFFFFFNQMNLHWQIIITQSPSFTLGFTLSDVLSMGLDKSTSPSWPEVLTLFSDCKLILLHWVDHWFSAFYIHVGTHLYDIFPWVVPRLFAIPIVLVVVLPLTLPLRSVLARKWYYKDKQSNLMDKRYSINLLLLLVIHSDLLPSFSIPSSMLQTAVISVK